MNRTASGFPSSGAIETCEPNTEWLSDAAISGVSVPWYLWCGVVAVTSASIGGAWDVSWHRSIGRDTFWTPAHIAIYACGVLAAIVCGYLILGTTFRPSVTLKHASVGVLGFRGPLGAFIAAWGGIAMLTSAPFDNWWHSAYGLDVKIISPPHTLLLLGDRAVAIGILFLVLAAMNSAKAQSSAAGERLVGKIRRLFLYLGGLLVAGQMFFILENTWDVRLHRASAYIAICVAIPVVLVALSRASEYRWTATATTAVYMLFRIGEILLLPLFPAQPKLGPVYHPVTHFIPAPFPILLIVPAFLLDLLWQHTRSWQLWRLAIMSGILFCIVLVVIEWPFADFLLSTASQNRLFGTMYFGYNASPTSYVVLRRFLDPSHGAGLAAGLLCAAMFSVIGTWIGLAFGNWMKRVQR